MLQFISDGGEMLAGDDRNKESDRQSSEVVNTSVFLNHAFVILALNIYYSIVIKLANW